MAVTSQIGIIDQTTFDGLTAGALAMWQAAVAGAERAGLARIVMTAGAGGGHASHGHGTEIDIVGYNADGSRWTPEQRVMVAAGAATAGANRFGFYSGGRGGNSLHVGLGYDGAPRNVAWGPAGRTSGVSVNAFHESERGFVMALRDGTMASYLPTVGAGATSGRPVDVRLTGPADFKAEVSSEDKTPDIEANRRAMIDSVAPAVRNVIERGGLIRVGIQGDAVRQVQAFLNANGFTDADGRALDEDGEFGRLTRQALMAYQEARGEVVDGILGRDTFGRMVADITGTYTGPAAVTPPVYTPSPPMQQAAAAATGEGIGRRSSGDAVRELQAWLNFHGFTDAAGNALEVDGDFGPLTEQALKAAQSAAGVPATGRLDEATAGAFQALDQHEVNVTLPDVNASAPVDEGLPPVAVSPVPDRTYEEIYDQPTTTDAQAAQYAAEKGLRTEPAPVAAPTALAAASPYMPPGWKPVPPAGPVPTTQQWAANRPATGAIGAPDGDPAVTDVYSQPDLTDAQRAQYQAERTAAVEAGTPMVRSAPAAAGQAVLSWTIPISAAPVGPLASPYPVRLTVQPTLLTRQQIAARDGAAIVAGANRMGAGVDPAAIVAGMPRFEMPGSPATPPQASANQAEVNRAIAAEEAANAAWGTRPYEGLTPAQMGQIDMSNFTAEERTAWHDAFALAMERQVAAARAEVQAAREARDAARAAGTTAPAAAAPATTPAPTAAPAGGVAGDFATMTREQLMGVDVTTLSREQWAAYDAALSRSLNELKSSGPNWLRDQLKRNGAPADRVATATPKDLIAISAQPNKRIVPTGTATAVRKPPKNTALDKVKLMTRQPTPGTAAA